MIFEWKLNDIERKASEALRRCDEMRTINSNVDSLERANREIRSDIDGLRAQLQAAQDSLIQLQQEISVIKWEA